MFKFLFLIVALVLATPLWAQMDVVNKESSLGQALIEMSSVQGFSTPFKQVLSYAEGGNREYTGELSVLRPGKFRWRYIKPYEQLYVSNGDGIWLYEPDLMQVQKLQDLGEVDPVVMQLLDGRIGLDAVHVLDVEKIESVDAWHVKLGEDTQAVEVWLGVGSNQLHWIESKDMLGNKNRLILQNVDTNLPDESIFKFVAPEGVDVIGEL